MQSPLIVIPARLAASRLPDKPLADIGGKPMIAHVVARGLEADIGPVVVACADEAIAEAARAAGAEAVMTRADHASGTDRVAEAAAMHDPDGQHPVVINLQGDVPFIEPAAIRAALAPLDDTNVAMTTIAVEIDDEERRIDPGSVKVVGSDVAPGRLRALYFSRATVPTGSGPHYHHIGLYAYRPETLRRFHALPPSALELRERLEQLRLLEAGTRIDVAIVDAAPFEVNTPDDLARARHYHAERMATANVKARTGR